MRRLHYHRIDVFTDRAFGGNPLAVFTNGRGVAAETMQAIAKEFNLSETTFVLPPDDPRNDWRVRIFTPGSELPMAGHPTIGTSFVLAREHLIRRDAPEASLILEEGVGPVPVRIEFEGGEPSYAEMSQPLPKFGPRYEDLRAVAEMFSLSPEDFETAMPFEVVSCGVPFLYACARTVESVRRIRFRADLGERVLSEAGAAGVFVFARGADSADAHVHSRMFAPGQGIFEDPATGGASGPLGCYLLRHGAMGEAGGGPLDFVSEQGVEMGRPSYIRIKIEHDGGRINGVKVGGRCHFMGEGFIEV